MYTTLWAHSGVAQRPAPGKSPSRSAHARRVPILYVMPAARVGVEQWALDPATTGSENGVLWSEEGASSRLNRENEKWAWQRQVASSPLDRPTSMLPARPMPRSQPESPAVPEPPTSPGERTGTGTGAWGPAKRPPHLRLARQPSLSRSVTGCSLFEQLVIYPGCRDLEARRQGNSTAAALTCCAGIPQSRLLLLSDGVDLARPVLAHPKRTEHVTIQSSVARGMPRGRNIGRPPAGSLLPVRSLCVGLARFLPFDTELSLRHPFLCFLTVDCAVSPWAQSDLKAAAGGGLHPS